MPDSFPDFSIVERTFERRLRAQGLAPTILQEGVATGYDRFALYRKEGQAVDIPGGKPGLSCFAHVEVRAVLGGLSDPPLEVLDLVTRSGDSPTTTLEQCAETFMDVTFPALRSLYDARPAPGATAVRMASFTPKLGRTIRWEVYSGSLQVLNDPDGQLAARLSKTPPYVLVFDTLTGFLAEPRIHWCKLFGAYLGRAGLTFGCAIDGGKSGAAEAEMRRKFLKGGPLTGNWEFRQFLALRPAGEADAATDAELREKAAVELGPPRRRWRWPWAAK